MFELKPISKESIPEALSKVERYRLLNESWLAESICLDILRIEPDNREALIALLLSRTDQFQKGATPASAREIVRQLTDPYERAYYSGLICEREASARLWRGTPLAGYEAYDSLCQAMDWFQQAEALRPPGNDDAILRWNTCARMIMRDASLRPRPVEKMEVLLDD